MPATSLPEVARYRVIFADCDPMRIMYNGSYFRLLEIGWNELFRQLGQPLAEYLGRGLYPVVIEAKCRYLKPARYDDVVRIHAALRRAGPSKFSIEHEIVGPSGDVLVRATTTHAVVDQEGRPQRVPEEIVGAAKTVEV
jgi:acyl-CoA thioester hydrolase